MKFKCNYCDTEIKAPRPHISAVDQRVQCKTCGAKYKQVLIRRIQEDG